MKSYIKINLESMYFCFWQKCRLYLHTFCNWLYVYDFVWQQWGALRFSVRWLFVDALFLCARLCLLSHTFGGCIKMIFILIPPFATFNYRLYLNFCYLINFHLKSNKNLRKTSLYIFCCSCTIVNDGWHFS